MELQRIRKIITPLFVIFCATFALVMAAEVKYGQIEGVVTDSACGGPIIGASIQIVGTQLGAISDTKGKYKIRLVTPGTFDLRFTTVGYAAHIIKGVVVYSELTAECNAALKTLATDLKETIEVYGATVIDKYEVSSMTKITAKSIRVRPEKSVDDVLQRVSGVVKSDQGETHIRGGKAGEIAYIVDGVTIRDPNSKPGTTVGLKGSSLAPPPMTFKAQPPPPPPPAHGGSAIVNGEAFDAMFYKNHGVNPFVDMEDDSLSTFAFDVDDASFNLARNYLNSNALPHEDGIRTEEFINHFKYNYQSDNTQPFSFDIQGAVSANKRNSVMLRIGVKARDVAPENRKDANLTFVIDVSGSMGREDRLGLVKRALTLLVTELKPNDQVGIVVYGSRGRIILDPTSIVQRAEILTAINSLHTAGVTNAEEGIRLGYQMANCMFEEGKINRVILCSDGVANVGRTGPEALLKQIREYAKAGITLSTVGFGMGNYNDLLMEKLGDKGDGHYAYVDDISTARRIFVDNLTGTLQVIARDVKAQMVFNPTFVRSYRLIGYENRDVADEDFRVDTVDGGEVGSGHEVTVLYEVKLKAGDSAFDGGAYPPGEIGQLYIRYKSPDGDGVTELKRAIELDCIRRDISTCSPDYRLALCAANFAEILRNSYWARDYSLVAELQVANDLYQETGDKDIQELAQMIEKTISLRAELAKN